MAILHPMVCMADQTANYAGDTRAFFGDLHVHTQYSADAFMFNARSTPDDAYRYARGGAIAHPSGFPIRLRGGALDFTAVTDHAELLGVLPAMVDSRHSLSKLPVAKTIQSPDRKTAIAAFREIMRRALEPHDAPAVRNLDVIRSAWQNTIEAAERNNQPGRFTTFVGYEYSSAPENQNLHRNVIFESAQVPALPFSSIESENPEDLWRWLDERRKQGMNALAIPHNANVSNGLMFQRNDWRGDPLDADYAALRMRNEPLVEVTQVKGTSETHPALSPNDEWAGFELYDHLIASSVVAKKPGGFVRQAYRDGLELYGASGFNPYKFGLIGSSDGHSGGGPVEEDSYFGKVGTLDGTAARRGSIDSTLKNTFGAADAASTFTQWSASGLMGVWAEENTRKSLFAAMMRKETFATSGPRIRLRFFAGFDYDDDILSDTEMVARAYRQGVSMGSDLSASGDRDPAFLVWALRDVNGGWLQRLQIIKGWIERGESFEQVFDVACADGLRPEERTHRCPDNGATVDPRDCSVSIDKGAVELRTLWRDPDFNVEQPAFYYVRVLENPTCRWSTWDALRAGVAPKPGIDALIQERAWSSPIWYLPDI